MICSSCHHEVRDDARFCDHCGAPITPPPVPAEKLTCLVCGEPIEAGTPFCPKCGMPSVASQADMTVVLPKKTPPAQAAGWQPVMASASGVAAEGLPELREADAEATRVIPRGSVREVADERTRVLPPAASQVPKARPAGGQADRPRMVVPMATNSSAEETIMVLDPPPAKPARATRSARAAEDPRAAAAQPGPHKSAKLAAELDRRKQRAEHETEQPSRRAQIAGGLAIIALLVLGGVSFAWYFNAHRARKLAAHEPVAQSAPVVAATSQPVSAVASVPAAVESQPVAVAQPVQSVPVQVEASASEPVGPVSSDLKTVARPALIIAPSMSGGAESGGAEKAEKERKTEAPLADQAVQAPAKSERKPAKAKPKSKPNQEEDYLRQIHRQLDRQR